MPDTTHVHTTLVTRISSGHYILLILPVVFLLPLFLYPLGPDTGLFFLSGQKIVSQGALPYRDFLDVKPPLIYYLYAAAIELSGTSPFSIHLVDLLLQSLTIVLLYRLIRTVGGSAAWGLVATTLYSLLYLSVGYMNVMQPESYVGLLVVGTLRLLCRYDRRSHLIAIGLLCGIAALFKFTFVLIAPAIILGDLLLLPGGSRAKLLRSFYIFCGTLLPPALFLLYLFSTGAYQGFREMQTFLDAYNPFVTEGFMEMVVYSLQSIPQRMSDAYSFLMLLTTMGGIALGCWNIEAIHRRSAMEQHDVHRVESRIDLPSHFSLIDARRLLRFATLIFLALLITVTLEGKWFDYHVSRLFAVATIPAGACLVWLWTWFADLEVTPLRRGGFAALIIFGLILGPLPRYSYHTYAAYELYRKSPESFDRLYAHTGVLQLWRMAEVKELGRILRSPEHRNQELYVVSGIAAMIYLEGERIPDDRIYHSGFLIASFAPSAWRSEARAHLREDQPELIVLHKSDRMAKITGSDTTSFELVQSWPDVRSMLRQEYDVIFDGEAFRLYQRRDRSDLRLQEKGVE